MCMDSTRTREIKIYMHVPALQRRTPTHEQEILLQYHDLTSRSLPPPPPAFARVPRETTAAALPTLVLASSVIPHAEYCLDHAAVQHTCRMLFLPHVGGGHRQHPVRQGRVWNTYPATKPFTPHTCAHTTLNAAYLPPCTMHHA